MTYENALEILKKYGQEHAVTDRRDRLLDV